MNAPATVLDWLEVGARNVLSFISDKVSAVSTAGWVLVAIAAVAALWAWAVMHASTRIGPIEVADIKADDTKLPLLALTGAFRQRLSEAGLAPPPAVPEGSPQANLIKAVEAIGSQGAAIGKVLELLPTPPRAPGYKVMATLTGIERPAPSAARCGVSYTLLPDTGVPHVQTVDDVANYTKALDQAGVDIYLHIAKSLPDVFPHWVRWRTSGSLNAYLAGLQSRKKLRVDAAASSFKAALDASPFNALAGLQLANLNETRGASSQDDWERAYFQAQALARYRTIGIMWPSVVEARYRASVVSAGLATTYGLIAAARTTAAAAGDTVKEKDKRDQCTAIQAIVPLLTPNQLAAVRDGQAGWQATDDDYRTRLRNFASRESSAAVQLLHPAYALLRLRRLRNQFESKGHDRRLLRNVVRISRHCIRIRRLNRRPKENGIVWEVFLSETRLRAFSIRWLTVLTDLSWQARYNAACFNALRLDGPYLAKRSRARIERRALRDLDRAIRESGGDLTRDLVRNDPDMDYFRHYKWHTT
jgi:hypothetical protein